MCGGNRHACGGRLARGRGFGPRRGCRRNNFGTGYRGEGGFAPVDGGQGPFERRSGLIGILAGAFGSKKLEKAQVGYYEQTPAHYHYDDMQKRNQQLAEPAREVVAQRQDQREVNFEYEKAGYDNLGFKEQVKDTAPPRYSFVGR